MGSFALFGEVFDAVFAAFGDVVDERCFSLVQSHGFVYVELFRRGDLDKGVGKRARGFFVIRGWWDV